MNNQKQIYDLMLEYDESAIFNESIVENGTCLYVEGPTLVYDQKNINGRIYPKEILQEAIDTHIGNGNLDGGACVGELNHPLGKRVDTDPDRISHKFVAVTDDGSAFRTKALIADGTTCGKQVKGLFDAGIRMGISSRAYGKADIQDSIAVVKRMVLNSLGDIVFNPSAPGAYLQALRESVETCEYIFEAGLLKVKDSNRMERIIDTHIDIINKAPIKKINEAALVIFSDFLDKCI